MADNAMEALQPETSLGHHLACVVRAVVVVALVLVPIMATREGCRGHEPGRIRQNVARTLVAHTGMPVEPADVVAVDDGAGKRGWHSARWVVFLGRRGNGQRDLFLVKVRFAGSDIPTGIAGPWNLTSTPEADEADVTRQGSLIACVSRVGGRPARVFVFDLAGEPSELTADWPVWERVLDRVTNFQETGRFSGVGRLTLELATPPRDVRLVWDKDVLRVEGEGGRGLLAVLSVREHRLEGAGEARLVVKEKGRRSSVITWAVDTVRNLSFVGPDRIARLESWVFRLVDKVQVLGARMTRYDGSSAIAEDLGVPGSPERPQPEGEPKPGQGLAGWPPRDLEPILRTHAGKKGPMPGEGKWVLLTDPYVARQPGLPPPFAETFLRVDEERPFSRVYLVAWDPRRLELHLVPGTEDPVSDAGTEGSGRIPKDGPDRERLAAAFSGGWQTVHGRFGMRAQGNTIVSPSPGLATFGRMRGGATAFGTWPRGLRKIPSDIEEFRQNLYPLFERGIMNPGGHSFWGRAHVSELELNYIRRSALCSTREGHVVFFYGESVSIYTLALAMQRAGCDYGLELDINRPNVSFEFYRVIRRAELSPDDPPLGVHEPRSRAAGEMPGRKDLIYFARSLVRGQGLSGFPRYIGTVPRDFVYLTLRENLPLPPLRPVHSPALDGEGEWQTQGLFQGPEPFPPAVARTHIRPDPRLPGVVVRLLAVDTRRVDIVRGPTLTKAEPLAVIVAEGQGETRAVAAGESLPDEYGLAFEGEGELPPRVMTGKVRGFRAERAGGVVVGAPLGDGAAGPGGRPGEARTLVGACSRSPFVFFAEAPLGFEGAAHKAFELVGCKERRGGEGSVRLFGTSASARIVWARPDKERSVGNARLLIVPHARPALMPMFAPSPEGEVKKKVDGEAILRRAIVREVPQ